MSDMTVDDQAVVMGETVAAAFESEGGRLTSMSRDALARDLARIVGPLLSTCTTAEWIEVINARLSLLENEAEKEGPRLVRLSANGVAEMTAPAP